MFLEKWVSTFESSRMFLDKWVSTFESLFKDVFREVGKIVKTSGIAFR
jgi:hypothetical protein